MGIFLKKPIFWIGVMAIAITMFFSGQVYMEQLIDLYAGYEGQEAVWFGVFEYCIVSTTGLLFVPLCAPLASGANTQIELQSRYALFCYSRTGKRKYCFQKLRECILSGGMMVVFAEMLVFLMVYVKMRGISEMFRNAEILEVSKNTCVGLVLGFENGAFWSVIGGIFAVLAKNQYLAYTMPFVLYYVLTIFQERYYRSLFFLSPKYWAAPIYYGYVVCVIVMLALLLLSAAGGIIAIKRRIENG